MNTSNDWVPVPDWDLNPEPAANPVPDIAEPVANPTAGDTVPPPTSDGIPATPESGMDPVAAPDMPDPAGHPLLDLIADESTTEVLVNGPGLVTLNQRGLRYPVDVGDSLGTDPVGYTRILDELLLSRMDTPVRLSDGPDRVEGLLTLDRGDRPPVYARVHVFCPPVARVPAVTIARKGPRLTLEQMVAAGSMTEGMAGFLAAAVLARLNIVVSGAMGHGKTTFLTALSDGFDPCDRVVQIEDSAELPPLAADTVMLTAPPDAVPGDCAWMEQVLRDTLRARATRIVLGEARGAEFASWLWAANTCASGSLTTLHAESPARALDKMVYYATGRTDRADERMVRREIAGVVNLVVQVALVQQHYLVTGIEMIQPAVNETTGTIATQPLFTYDGRAGVFRSEWPQDWVRQMFADRAVHLLQTWFQPGQ